MTTTPHKHAEVIKAWADGAKIECRGPKSPDWIDSTDPQWFESHYYRVKPAQPDKIYPKTDMTEMDMSNEWSKARIGTLGMIDIANAALRHACDNGQIVTREEFDRAIGDRKARDIAVARAVDAWYCQTFSNKHPNTENYLADIIKGIKP